MALCWSVWFSSPERYPESFVRHFQVLPRSGCSPNYVLFFFAQFNRDSVQLPREICGLRAQNLHHITDSQLLQPIHPIRSRHRSVVHEYSNWSNSADERNSPARILGLLGCLQGFMFFHVAKLSRAEAVNCRRPRRSSRCLVRSPDDLHGEKTQIMTTMVSLRNSGTGASVAVFSFGSAAPGNWKNVCWQHVTGCCGLVGSAADDKKKSKMQFNYVSSSPTSNYLQIQCGNLNYFNSKEYTKLSNCHSKKYFFQNYIFF